jgi:hypothetical protein
MSLSNALGNAAAAITETIENAIGGTITGANPVTQPSFGNLFGINIPGTPLISTRDYFLFQLQSWVSSFPLQSQWIALIERFPTALNTNILQGLERVDGGKSGFDINAAKTILTSYPYQRVSGCLFCNGATLPGESLSVTSATVPNNRGFIPGVVSGDRKSYADTPLILQFFETNTSFVDFILRPWVILASHYGFVAREDDTPNSIGKFNVKTNITLLYFTRTYQNISMVPRKVFKFFNCVPINISTQEYGYDEPTSTKSYGVNFAYTNYTISNSLFLPVPTIINTIKTPGSFDISPL